MATFNAPVAQVVQDRDLTVVLKITGQYNAAQGISNTKVLTANSVRFANTSRLCILDVVNIQFAMSTVNAFASLEYMASNGNTTIATFGRNGTTGEIIGLISNPVGANTANGDINLYLGATDANDAFTMMITLRKNDYNGAFANLNAQYN